ncbi:FIG006285: ICC-like protein phosphoesterase [hydrothermal vent metagenome]|uniref:FIG006285: ICC-like protein phosphoesterase n=1 Tax=hydrothermal vent metagenome TaxID=652676 RepID=A0A1W1BAM0_9ZZZZ
MNPILFSLVLLGVFSLLNMYISKRLISRLSISTQSKHYFRIFLYLNLLGIFLYTLGRYSIEFPNWLYFLFSLPVGFLFLLFCVALLYDLFYLILSITPVQEERRKFFKKSLDIGTVATAVALTTRSIYEARTVVLEDKEIKINKLSQSYKILQLSDIHIGGLIDTSFIRDIVNRVNKCKPDLVVITGDLIDIDIDRAEDTLEELRDLKSKYGTYFIVGNHEYFHGIEVIIKKVKDLGIRVLENENLYIGELNKGFNLAGVYDLFGYRAQKFIPDINKALQNRDTDSPTILLAHQPKFLEEINDLQKIDLVLSGHTHGGQLLPFRALVRLQQPYISGLHQHTPFTQIYVNKGTGFWGPPMRLGASAEITQITLLPTS